MSRMIASLRWWVHRCVGFAFDALHGVETSAIVPSGSLGVTSRNRDCGVPYDPSPWRILHRSLRLTGIPAPDGFTFVDIGCGKGKVVLSAMTFPFKKVIGIEFSPYLCEIARRNLYSARLMRKSCRDAEIMCMDAADWKPPNEPLMLFFYNPFHAKVMADVARNLVMSYSRNPRSLFFLFFQSASSGEILERALAETNHGPELRLTSGRFGNSSVSVYCLGSRP